MSKESLVTIADLERRLLDPDVRSSRSELQRLIADDFVEIGRSGRVWHKDDLIDALVQSKSPQIEVDSEVGTELGIDVVLFRYRSRRVGHAEQRETHRSSIWRRHDGRWQIVFHQGTPVGE